MKPDPNARALNAIIRDLMNTRDGATYFAGRVWGVFIHYNLGGDHPLVGHGDRIRYISGSAKDRLAVSAALIRPDEIIAWAADSDPDCSELQRAAARWFVRIIR